MKRWVLIAVALLLLTPPARAQDRSQGRSMVISRHGVVATEHPLASQAAAMVLARGGHAVDAAITANAVMGVVAPMWNGIGGDLFAIVYDATRDELHGLNASGWAAAGLTIEVLKSRGVTRISGIHSVTVPGAVAGWAALRDRFGRKPIGELLEAAIGYAEEGVPIAELNAEVWANAAEGVRRDANAARTYLPGGAVPRAGQLVRFPDLAWSYRQVARDGADAFYKGEIARRIVSYSERQGGTMTAADLAEFRPEWIAPISTTYRGWTVYEMPPSGQGIAALAMLNLMEQFPLNDYGHNSAEALHRMIEAKKLAYADMARHVADPKFATVPVAAMLSKPYARERARLIDTTKAACDVPAGRLPTEGGDTIYLSVVDRDGNMVSLIQSVYASFGSGLVADGTGFVLHNRGALFDLNPDHPNALRGRKRPLHTIIPAFMSRGDVRIAFGIMGGWNQSQAHAQFVANVVDYGMNIQAALEAARFSKTSFSGCDVRVETRIPEAVRAELTRRGHEIRMQGDFSGAMGGGQAVMRDFAAGINYGASDPRKDGAAIPEPLPGTGAPPVPAPVPGTGAPQR